MMLGLFTFMFYTFLTIYLSFVSGFRSIHMHVIQSRQEPLYLCNFTMYIHLNLYSIAQMQACSSCNFMFEIHYQKFFLQCWSRYLYQVYLFLHTRYMRMHICIIDILKPFIGPELLNVSIRRIRLNSRILLNKKIGVNSIYKVIDVYVYLDVM